MFEIDYLRIFLIVLLTIIVFFWIRRVKDKNAAIWFAALATFLCVYSGMGAAIDGVPNLYLWYYCIYIFILSLTIKILYRNTKSITFSGGNNRALIVFIAKYGKVFIIIYYLLIIFPLLYPSFNISILFHPPTPSLEDIHFNKFEGNESRDFISSILYILCEVIRPFFYLSLSKYKRKPLLVLFILLGDLYIGFCQSGIFGRGQAMILLMLFVLSYWEDMTRKMKRFVIISGLASAPIIFILFVQFASVRIGNGAVSISPTDAFEIVAGQEISYPTLFEDYYKSSPIIGAVDYFLWLVLLPLPGFLKFGYGDPLINYRFTVFMTGKTAQDIGFSILLPGVLGESIITFGPIFFFIHAIILGVITVVLVSYFRKIPSFSFLFFFFMFTFTYSLSRAGTTAAYSFFAKQFIILVITIYLIKKNKGFRYGDKDF